MNARQRRAYVRQHSGLVKHVRVVWALEGKTYYPYAPSHKKSDDPYHEFGNTKFLIPYARALGELP